MKHLSEFLEFNWNIFSKDKQFRCTGCTEWVDYNSKAHCGTKVEVVITSDRTPYHTKAGETVSNLYEKLTFKSSKDVSVPIGSYVVPVNPIAIVYGEYRNMLSIKCDDIRILQPSGSAGAK